MKKCLLLEIITIRKVLPFRMKYNIDGGVYLIVDTHHYTDITMLLSQCVNKLVHT